MMTELDKQIERGVAVLRTGGVVAYPTDTLFGLGADGFNSKAVRRVFAAKTRPLSEAVPLLLADVADMERVAVDVPDVVWRLAQTFWPGALTLVVWRGPAVPDVVTAGGPRVAVRVPRHPVPLGLARGLGAPLVGTSANRHGAPNPRTPEEIVAQLGKAVGFVITSGPPPGGTESTVLDVTVDPPRIMRQGAVARVDIEEVCGLAP
ncbi:MAG: L-threonylcarbamoyladenylate synthase [Dehalococcoidia bacterium]|nr:L-threonylcarbamoyladenylate synthase [Dehalococcoidia bacterium]